MGGGGEVHDCVGERYIWGLGGEGGTGGDRQEDRPKKQEKQNKASEARMTAIVLKQNTNT